MMAGADDLPNPVPGDPGPQQTGLTSAQESAITASANPKYALKNAAATDGNVATAGYVKGAYNAAIKGINALSDEWGSLDTALYNARVALENAESSLEDNYATKSGVAATVNAATTSGSFTGATVSGSFSNATISGSVTGSASGTIPAMTTWGSDTPGTADATATLSNATVEGSASGTMTGTASGTTTGGVSVDGYHAS